MEGEGERKRETETGSEKANTSANCTHTHTELSRWVTVWWRWAHSLLYTSQRFSSIQASSCTFPRSLLLLFLLLPLSSFCTPFPLPSLVRLFSPPALWPRMKAVQTQPVSSGVPQGALSNLSTVVFSLFPFFLPRSYLFTAGCLFSFWLFYREYAWALSLPCSALYRSLLKMFSPTQTSSLSADCESVSGSCMWAQYVCHICWNHKVMISGLSCHRRRVESVCVAFHHNWQNIMRERKRERAREKEWEKQFELKTCSSVHNGLIVHWM